MGILRLNNYKKKIRELILDIEPYEVFNDDTDLFQKGIMKSLCFMYLVTELEREYGFIFPEEGLDIRNFDTVDHISDLLISINET